MLLAAQQLPFIPFIHSAEDVMFAVYVFTRVSGLFLAVPLFSNRTIPSPVRSLFAGFCALILIMMLYPDYRGEDPRYVLPELDQRSGFYLSFVGVTLLKELSIGYILGLIFHFAFEGLLIAGQNASFMMGLSISQILDPVSGTSQTLIGQMFMILGTLLVLALDIHHQFISIIRLSFDFLPIGYYELPQDLLGHLAHGTGRMWHYGLQFAAIPFIVLFVVTVGLGFMAKIMPEMNIFMVGFPLKIFVGYYGLLASISIFPRLLLQAFTEYEHLARIFIGSVAGSQ